MRYEKVLILLINVYQRMPLNTHASCLFIPTCSEYMKISIERFGVVKGVSLGIKRIMRCHNRKEITIDMVPTKEDL